MKIKEFNILNYGPIHNIRHDLDNFNLFFGENEHGKTFIIESLVRLLLESKDKDNKNLIGHRVKSKPIGNIIVEQDLEDHTISDDKSKKIISEITSLDVKIVKNIFIIHNSELIFKDESDFLDKIMTSVTGISLQPINDIQDNLRKNCYLTPKLSLEDKNLTKIGDQIGNKIASRLESAKSMIDKLKEKKKEISDEKYDKIEIENAELNLQLKKIKSKLDQLDKARNRQRYEIGKKNLDEFSKKSKIIEENNFINDEDSKTWSNNQINIKNEEENYADQNNKISSKKQEKQNIESDLETLKEKMKKNEKISKSMELQKNNIDEYKKKDRLLHQFNQNANMILNLFKLSAIPFIISFVLILILRNLVTSIFFGIFASLFLLFFCLSYIIPFITKFLHDKLDYEIRMELNSSGFSIPDDISLIISISHKREEIQSDSEEKIEKNAILGQVNKQISDRYQSLDEISQNKSNLSNEIEVIKKNSSKKTYEDYQLALKYKRDAETELEHISKNLNRELLDKEDDSNHQIERIKQWKDKLKQLEQYKEAAVGITYNTEEEENNKKEYDEINEKIQENNSKLELLRKDLSEFEEKIRYILADNEIQCKQTTDFENIIEELRVFGKSWEQKQKNTISAYNILDEIKDEEHQELKNIFDDTYLWELIDKITEGFYKDISYDLKEKKIYLQQKDDHEILAENLSAGTLDQLYFAIRLAFSKKLMGEKTCFFILDDPFIKSDIKRLHKLLDVLIDLSTKDWQILYFSAKSEVREYLEGKRKMEEIKIIPVDCIERS